MSNTNSGDLINCNYCDYCDSCDYCYYCYYCDSCNYCYYCYYCDSCNYCDYCYSCNYCDYSANLRMSERMLFCLGDENDRQEGAGYQKNNCVFNTQVSRDEWYNATKSLPIIKLDLENGYKEAWQQWWNDASKKDKQAILGLPHFNAEIFEGITGIKVNQPLEETEVITLNGKKYRKVKDE